MFKSAFSPSPPSSPQSSSLSYCSQHHNPIQRICLHPSCNSRSMCLLCQTHLHGKPFISIMDKPSQNYHRFTNSVAQQIDFFLLQLKNSDQQIIRAQQKQLIQQYYKQLKQRLQLFIEDLQKQLIKKLQSQKFQTIEKLKSARADKNFLQTDQKIFKVCLRAYQGEKILEILQSNELMKSQQVYRQMQEMHVGLTEMMERYGGGSSSNGNRKGFNMKIKVPEQIRDIADKSKSLMVNGTTNNKITNNNLNVNNDSGMVIGNGGSVNNQNGGYDDIAFLLNSEQSHNISHAHGAGTKKYITGKSHRHLDLESSFKNNQITSKATLLCQSQPFDSIISSSVRVSSASTNSPNQSIMNQAIFSVGYDKKLRIHRRAQSSSSSSFQLLMEKEYGNILTKIHQIGQDGVFAIGQSKELLIEKVIEGTMKSKSDHADDNEQDEENSSLQCKNIMKLRGHKQRIIDIHAYNTRIVGSCSQEGTKIWDLYKQRCEFTFRCQESSANSSSQSTQFSQSAQPNTLLFLPPNMNLLCIGYTNHTCKLYSIEKLKQTRKYQLPGLPLVFAQERLNENTFYIGGFDSHLSVLDVRLAKLAFSHNFGVRGGNKIAAGVDGTAGVGGGAVMSLSQMIFQQNSILLGFREGAAKVFDLGMRKTRVSFLAENENPNGENPTPSHLSKPNGIIAVYQEGERQIVTVSCNQRKVKLWEVNQQQ